MDITKTKERFNFLDVARGILIILVVIGHTSDTAGYANIIYWFHMPAFFILSGYLLKIPNNSEFVSWTLKNIKKFFIPYLSFFSVFYLLPYAIKTPDIISNVKYIIKFLYGGRMVGGAFWFITCLFLTQIIFVWLKNRLAPKTLVFVILALYVLGHIESINILPQNPDYFKWSIIYKYPLGIDICLISLTYMLIGFYFKKYSSIIVEKIKIYQFVALNIICIAIISLYVIQVFDYKIDMKASYYKNYVLDILIPVMFTMWIVMISKHIERYKLSKFLIYVGKNTLTIMYIHIAINLILQNRQGYGVVEHIILGISISLIFSYLINKFDITKALFLGVSRKKTQIEISS